jgi:dienelactone hydrolase
MGLAAKSDWGDRYHLAQAILVAETNVRGGTVQPRWIENSNCFWYDREGDSGTEYRVIEAASGCQCGVVPHRQIAKAVGARVKSPIADDLLILHGLRIGLDPLAARFEALGIDFIFDCESGELHEEQKSTDPTWNVSPDGLRAVFVRDDNLWLRDLQSGEERALTQGGRPEFAYASRPSSARVSRQQIGIGFRAEGVWSPDSRRFLTVQTDDRDVPELPLVDYAPVGERRPRVSLNRTSLPGDPRVTEFRMLSIEVGSGHQVSARYAPLSAVRMNDTPFAAGLAWWSHDGRIAHFVDIERGEKAAHVVTFDVETGETSKLFSERTATYLELSVSVYAPALAVPLPESSELIWYSERTGRGHLYLYDLTTGQLKHPVTSGEWQVREVQRVDASRREVFFSAGGIMPDEDPYNRKPCIAQLDTGQVRVLSSDPGDHIVWRENEFALAMLDLQGGDRGAVSAISPDGNYFVETVGTSCSMPRTVLRRRSGEMIAAIDEGEDAGLPMEWTWPEPVKLKATDGQTDLFGILFKPPGFALGDTYPLIDYIYGGPQVSHTPKTVFADGGFSTSAFLEAAHLAALGAYVLVIDGRGTAYREKSFREASYGAVQTASNLEDHVASIEQLAANGHSIDLDRVGICGFSGGGYMTAIAALRFGQMFKVAVAAGGNYDQALFWHSWGERYHGPYSEEHYSAQAAKTYADGLTGKLMLIHGLLDSGCHPAGLFQLVQALIEANKDFDLVVLPRAAHDITGYGARRRLDYFVRHLFGEVPPASPSLQTGVSGMIERLTANAAAKASVTSSAPLP